MIMTTPEMVLLMTTLGGAFAWAYEKYSGRGAIRVATEKTKTDVSAAIIEQLSKEREYLIKTKDDTHKSNLELIASNKELIKANEGYSKQVHDLSLQVQELKNQIELLRIQMTTATP